MRIPDIITFTRLALLPLIAAGIYLQRFDIALGLYVLAALSDWLDGFVARKLNQKTAFGAMIDQITDKVFILVLLLILADTGILNGWWILPAALIVAREVLVSGLREHMALARLEMPVSKLAKYKTASQMAALGLLIAAPLHAYFATAGEITLMLAAILSVITAGDYMKLAQQHNKKA